MESNLLDQEMLERLLAYVNGELEEEERLAVERWMLGMFECAALPTNSPGFSEVKKLLS